jgi:chromosome segregation ATPase
MARKILSWTLIVLSTLFLVLSLAGIGAAWIYNGPVTRKTLAQLETIDHELELAQATLKSSQVELERTLRILDAAQLALDNLAQQSTDAQSLFENIQGTLDDQLLPELKTTRERIDAARETLESLQTALETVSSFIPSVDLTGPDQILLNLIDSARSLDSEIAHVEGIARQASTFVSDTSYLLGGDLTETKASLESFLQSTKEYQIKVTSWRGQIAQLTEDTPKWIDRTSLALTFLLLWFGLSQFGLLLHGLSLRRGDDPLEILRRERREGWRLKEPL